MADIFSSIPGTVVVVANTGIPMTISMEDWGGYSGYNSVITGFQMQARNSVYTAHSLRDFNYIFSFGDRFGMMQIQGTSFAVPCETGNLVYHGLEYASGYYLLNRAASRPVPVMLVLGGGTPFFGFLTDMTLESRDADSLIGSFSYQFRAVPSAGVLDF